MRNIFLTSTFAAVCLVLIGGAVAQEPDWYHHREERFRGENWRAHLFAEVREDLNHVQSVAFSGRDEYRIARTKEELNELQADLEAHRYNQTKLDEVIGALGRVVADNRMPGRERDILNDDLQRLRDYREHHEHWGHQ